MSPVDLRVPLRHAAATAGHEARALYRSGRSRRWLKIKNPAAPAVRRDAEEEWR
jgi:hypothetical protein